MIHVENLTKYYDDFCAVNQISLDIAKGGIVGLLGPNGAGKTTTLRMLTGYFLPTSGTIHVKTYSVYDNLLEIKKLMGYLPESAPLYHGMLVYDYLDYVACIRELRNSAKISRIRQLVGLCGLSGIMHSPIGELSKGLKQRVGLAHAMMNDPEILILDEPTQGLDPNQIVEIRHIIKKIGQEKTIIFSTHILSEAEATCDRIIILNRGKIVADGDTEDLKQSAGTKTVIQISLLNADLESVKTVLSAVNGIDQITKIDDSDVNVLKIKAFCNASDDLRGKVYETIKATDWVMIEFIQETKTLETIFSDLTRQIH